MLNATFNNISVISLPSVLLMEEYAEKTSDLSQVTDKLYHITNILSAHDGPSKLYMHVPTRNDLIYCATKFVVS